jgi:hypothetical protein
MFVSYEIKKARYYCVRRADPRNKVPFGRYLNMTRASGIAARGAGMKFHQWPAGAGDQVWQ